LARVIVVSDFRSLKVLPMGRAARRTKQGLALLILSILAAAQEPKAAQSPQPSDVQSTARVATPVVDNDFSKEAIIFEHNATKVTYNADGTGTRETTVVMRVQSQAGVQELAVLTFPYTSYNDTVELDYVRVRKPDGTVIPTPEYNIQDMPADVTRNAPMYSDLHEKHVTVKALGVGDVLEYLVRYRIVKPQVPGQFWFQHAFTKTYIAKSEELEISIPRDKYVKVSSPDLPPAVKEESGRTTYTWKTSNLNLKEREALLKKHEAPRPSVQITTFHSWEEVGHWYDELQRSQVAVTSQIQAKEAELTKGLSVDDDKIRAIYDYVSTRLHYVSLSFGIGRYQPHAAEDVLENEYADCKDKHTLLAALLKAAGYDSWPALINSSSKLEPEVPSPAQFDHVISVVPLGSRMIWLDTTPAVAPFGLLLASLRDKQALVMPTGKAAALMTTPAQPPFQSLQKYHAEGSLGSDGVLSIHVQQTMRGDTEVLYRAAFWNVPSAQWKDLGQRISAASGFGGDVTNVAASAPDELDKPFQFSYDYTRKDYATFSSNHQIIAPLPWFGIEGASSEEQKPEGPVKLGALGKVVFESVVKLPAGYTPKYSEKKDLTQDFADYNAIYEINHGELIANRVLTIKKSEVPISSWESYKLFCKVLSDERDRYIDLVSGATIYPAGEGPQSTTATATAAPSIEGSQPSEGSNANPEIVRLMEEGNQALQNRDLTRGEEAYRHVIALDPKYLGAHERLGWIYLAQNNQEGGISELRKEEEYNPGNLSAYQMLGSFLQQLRRYDEATQQYRELLKRDPGNRDAALNLAALLTTVKKDSQAAEVLEKAVEMSPDSQALLYALVQAYLRNKQSDKALATLKKTRIREETIPSTLNSVAYSMADANVSLDLAAEYADRALHQAETESLKAEDDNAALINTQLLSKTWGTVGWIYFRKGDHDKALPYLKSAWLLSQDGATGNHLAQLYEDQGKKQDAAHQYLLALAASSANSNENKAEITQRYKKLTGQDPDEAPKLRRGPPSSESAFPGEELSRMRTKEISANPHAAGSAVFTVIFSQGKSENAKYVSGVQSLESMASQIRAAKIDVELPDASPVRIVRRGILMCGSTGCSFTFLLPDFAHAMDSAPSN